jgi:hypothetical protein
MADQLGVLEITCDAPPYYIVQVCDLIGIEAPEDVRWLRLSHYLEEEDVSRAGSNKSHQFLGFLRSKPRKTTCTCGQKLPSFDRYTFTISTGEEPSYLLGQCRRCRTVYWEDA